MSDENDRFSRGEQVDMRALGETVEEWVDDGDHEKAARAIMRDLPVEIGEAICALKMNEVLGDPERPVAGGPSVSIGEAFGMIEICGRIPDANGFSCCRRLKGHDGPCAHEPIDARDAEIKSTPSPVERIDDIELVITDQAFEPSYGGWNIQFQAIGAPRLAHQSTDPCLEAYVKLEVVDTSRRLTSGGSTSLARVDEDDEPSKHALSMLADGTAEGNILASGLGAGSVDTGPVREVPLAMPSEEAILAAMQRSLEVHLEKVREERARLRVTETAESFVGKSFKIRPGS